LEPGAWIGEKAERANMGASPGIGYDPGGESRGGQSERATDAARAESYPEETAREE